MHVSIVVAHLDCIGVDRKSTPTANALTYVVQPLTYDFNSELSNQRFVEIHNYFSFVREALSGQIRIVVGNWNPKTKELRV